MNSTQRFPCETDCQTESPAAHASNTMCPDLCRAPVGYEIACSCAAASALRLSTTALAHNCSSYLPRQRQDPSDSASKDKTLGGREEEEEEEEEEGEEEEEDEENGPAD